MQFALHPVLQYVVKRVSNCGFLFGHGPAALKSEIRRRARSGDDADGRAAGVSSS